ncbi:transporter substrate-binding domain-containing protein [Pantoea sp. S62]|nr:transporter substrate-binding domain-containing protein [Pantoea sp. S62]
MLPVDWCFAMIVISSSETVGFTHFDDFFGRQIIGKCSRAEAEYLLNFTESFFFRSSR